jgi:cell division protein FtsQ
MPKKTIDVQTSGLSHVIGRIAMVCGVVVGLGALLLVEVQAESFLKRDSRFFLERSQDFGEPPPNLQIDGLVHASREDVLKVFEEDLGRSVYLLDLEKRRLALLGMPWVSDATVSRHWPDRVSVRIVERKPIAFVKQADAAVTLIDASGFLMNAPASSQFHLPVVSGVGPDVTETLRLERMQRVEKLIRDLGPKIADISEIDAHDIHNLLLIRPLKGRAVTLKMGSKNFGSRYNTFLALADDLLERLPNGVTFDLRLEEQVTVGEDPALAAPQPKPAAISPAPAAVAPPVVEAAPPAPKPVPKAKKAAKTTEKKTEKKRRKNGR